jgi:hypothetical protein
MPLVEAGAFTHAKNQAVKNRKAEITEEARVDRIAGSVACKASNSSRRFTQLASAYRMANHFAALNSFSSRASELIIFLSSQALPTLRPVVLARCTENNATRVPNLSAFSSASKSNFFAG